MPSALITGANRGLGLEFARQYLADGWRVYAARWTRRVVMANASVASTSSFYANRDL
jgi:NAD(P)-dependent dehydrogenase (short-subunit alcohol dehydrogenase family)